MLSTQSAAMPQITDAMFRICSSINELDIEGTDEDFIQLRRIIMNLLMSPTKHSIGFQCDENYDPAPYSRLHSSIRIKIGVGPLHFDHSQQDLQVLGSFQALKHFSDNFPDGVLQPGSFQYHYHYDNISFPEYVSSDSPSLTLSLRSSTLS